MAQETWAESRLGWFRGVAVIAAVLSLASLLFFPWWPSDFDNPTLLGFRASMLADPFHGGLPGIAIAYLQWGCFVQLFALVAQPVTVFFRPPWRLPAGILVVLTTGWQAVAMLSGELVQLTVAAWFAPMCQFVLLLCWLGLRPQGASVDV